jgi:tetratricopeptide (TPR) repeat protein
VRVADFGLAHLAHQAPDGGLFGTPAYMAPEQRDGRVLDGRTDLFAYAVSLAEALASAGVRETPPWLRELLGAARAREPSARPPTIRAVVDAIVRHRRRRSRIPLVALAALPLFTVAATTGRVHTPHDPCGAPSSEMIATWNPARAVELERGFAATGSGGRTTWPSVRESLDVYAAGWDTARRTACEATHVAHLESPAMLDRRTACLRRAHASFAAVVDFLGRGDATAVGNAFEALGKLADPARCAQGDLLSPAFALPTDPDAAAQVTALSTEIAALEIAVLDERFSFDERAERALADARRLGWTPQIVAAASVVAAAAARDARFEDVREAYGEAVTGAIAIGDDVLAARLASDFATVLVTAELIDEAEIWIDVSLAHARRTDVPIAGRIRVQTNQAEVLRQTGRHAEALALNEETVALVRRHDHGDALATALHNLALSQLSLGDVTGAGTTIAESLAVGVRTLGTDHPRQAHRVHSAAHIDLAAGRVELALERARSTIATIERWYGPDHGALDEPLNTLATALRLAGRASEAVEPAARYLRATAAHIGPRSVRAAMAEANLAMIEIETGDLDAAERHVRHSLAVFEAALGPEDRELINVLVAIGYLERQRGAFAASAATLTRAVTIAEDGLGADHAATINPRIELANTLIAAGRGPDAVAALAPAIAIIDRRPDLAAPMVAEARAAMAQARRITR